MLTRLIYIASNTKEDDDYTSIRAGNRRSIYYTIARP